MLSNRGLGINAKKCVNEVVIVPTPLYGSETYGMRSSERRKVNVIVKWLQSLVGVIIIIIIFIETRLQDTIIKIIK